MAGCSPIVFQNVTRQKFEAVRARATADATRVVNTGDSGSATGPTPLGNITVIWSFNEPALQLTLQCIEKPLLVPAGTINAKIQSMVGSALNA